MTGAARPAFTAQLHAALARNDSLLCVGLDPDPARFPLPWRGDALRIFDFCGRIVDATADLVIAFKPQIAYFAANRAEDQLRQRFRPILRDALLDAGLRPGLLPEETALKKTVEELLDRISSVGFLAFGDVRDAIARGQMKLPDLGGPNEYVRGDSLLRLDSRLATELDGVYRRAESYTRWLERLTAFNFGTETGRWLTRNVTAPFGLAFLIADMEAAVTTARAAYLHAARLKDAGRAFSKEAAVAKLVATDVAMKVTTDAVQVLGGAGYTEDFPLERYLREAKVTQIFEGTKQIQRLVISRHVLAN